MENGIGQDPNAELAVDWYRMASTQGYARAQNCLGSCYYRGYGVEQDYGEAVMWYRKAAEQVSTKCTTFYTTLNLSGM
jgi:TPR repeat protein